MAYSVRHITSFQYEPAVRESVMEVRMQPRTDFRQRCLSFSLNDRAAREHDDVPRFLRERGAQFRHSGAARSD